MGSRENEPVVVERTCTGCEHLLRGGSCGQPEIAGLVPREHGFGIVWPDADHAEACPAFAAKVMLAKEPGRPHKLTLAEMAAAHAIEWDDAAIGRFLAREARLQRRGFNADDAADLAERQHLLDVQGEGRRMCLSCTHLERTLGGWRCGNAAAAGMGRELAADVISAPQRCAGFLEIDTQSKERHQ